MEHLNSTLVNCGQRRLLQSWCCAVSLPRLGSLAYFPLSLSIPRAIVARKWHAGVELFSAESGLVPNSKIQSRRYLVDQRSERRRKAQLGWTRQDMAVLQTPSGSRAAPQLTGGVTEEFSRLPEIRAD